MSPTTTSQLIMNLMYFFLPHEIACKFVLGCKTGRWGGYPPCHLTFLALCLHTDYLKSAWGFNIKFHKVDCTSQPLWLKCSSIKTSTNFEEILSWRTKQTFHLQSRFHNFSLSQKLFNSRALAFNSFRTSFSLNVARAI